jgi:hypothetical protein
LVISLRYLQKFVVIARASLARENKPGATMDNFFKKMQGGRRKRKKPEPTKSKVLPSTRTGTPSMSPPHSPVAVKKEHMHPRSTAVPEAAAEQKQSAKSRKGGKAYGDDGRFDRLQRYQYVAEEEDKELTRLMNTYYSSKGGRPHEIAELAWSRGNERDYLLDFYKQAKLEIGNLEAEKKSMQEEASETTAKLLEATDKLARLARRSKPRVGTKSILSDPEEEDQELGQGKKELDPPLSPSPPPPPSSPPRQWANFQR